MACIRKRGDSYTIRVSLGYDMNGKKICHSMTWKPDHKMTEAKADAEVKRIAFEFEEKLKCGYTPQKSYTLERYVKEIWMSKASKEVKPLTYNRYIKLLSRILPSMGYMKLENIQPPQIRTLIDDLMEDKREDLKYTPKSNAVELAAKCNKSKVAGESGLSATTILSISRGNPVAEESAMKFSKAFDMRIERIFDRNEEPLSPTTILHHFRVLSTVMTSAMQDGFISDNPLKRVKPPKAGKHKCTYLNDQDARRLTELVRSKAPHPFDMIVIMLLQTGMRRGECCGLTWSDIDFENNTISINKSLLYLPERGVFEDTPKNESSVRVIKVGKKLMTELREYKRWQDSFAEKVRGKGTEWEDSGRVFASNTGGNINPGTVTSWFHRFMTENDLPYVSIHGLRHTNATLMIFQGMPLTTAADRLGHSTSATTAKIYVHPIAEASARAAEYFDDLFDRQDEE